MKDRYIKNHGFDLRGKKVALTGATGGLGNSLCRMLLASGASLLTVDRNINKQRALVKTLRRDFPGCEIECFNADMEDISSVKNVCLSLKAAGIDYLILNAGAYSIPRHKTSTGYDNVFQINFVSPYFIARELLSGIREKGGRIVAVGSIAHNYSHTDPNDTDFSTRTKASLVYGNAKRYLMYSLLSLGGGVAVAHPGISFTGITAHYPKWLFAIIKYPMKVIFPRPDVAARSIYRALGSTSDGFVWTGPEVFDIWGAPKTKKLTTADLSEREYIAKTAEKIYNEV